MKVVGKTDQTYFHVWFSRPEGRNGITNEQKKTIHRLGIFLGIHARPSNNKKRISYPVDKGHRKNTGKEPVKYLQAVAKEVFCFSVKRILSEDVVFSIPKQGN
jgi:hypothetical protein